MIEVLLRVLQVILALGLIGVVLLQRSEGGGLGIGSSGGMGSFMSVRGTANFLTRVTSILAGLFMVTCLALALMAKPADAPRSIFDTPTAPVPAPVAPLGQTPAVPAPTPAERAPETAPQAEAPPTPTAPTPAPQPPEAAAPAAPAPTVPPVVSTPTTEIPAAPAQPATPTTAKHKKTGTAQPSGQ